MKNAVQLIAYASRFGTTVDELHHILDHTFGAAVGGIHVLPFFTPYDGADAGFDPDDHTAVDPRLGTWEDVARLGADYDLVVDVIVNHVSSRSAAFTDFRKRGNASSFADLFLTFSTVFPDGATEADLAAIYRPRPGLPFTAMSIAGEKRLIWTTFTSDQIDINVDSDAGRAYLDSILTQLAAVGVKLIRLDAAGYAVKTPGTSCFMTDESFAFIATLTQRAHELGMDVLVEVHSHYESQVEIAQTVDRVYDFAIPPLVLYSTYTGDVAPLAEWIRVRPTNCVTVLDTHDGIGVIDVGPDTITGRPGLLTAAQIDALVEGIHLASAGQSRLATGASASNLDIYQVNSTFFDALGRNDEAYLLARAVQFFVPGIPQVYYVGALAGTNDLDLLAKSGVGRDINRHAYTIDEVEAEAARPVVAALRALMRVRSLSPVFDGTFGAESTDAGVLELTWTSVDAEGLPLAATLVADFGSRRGHIVWTEGGTVTTVALSNAAELAGLGY